MPPWDGILRKTHKLYHKGDWITKPRCQAITKSSGGGYSGPHQCTHSATVEYNRLPMCYIHLKQRVTRIENNREYAEAGYPIEKKAQFKVGINLPQNVSITDMQDYIKEAVSCWCKSFRPPGSYDEMDEGDPLFEIDSNSVTVKPIKRKERL